MIAEFEKKKTTEQDLEMHALLVTATDMCLSYSILSQLPIGFHPSRCE